MGTAETTPSSRRRRWVLWGTAAVALVLLAAGVLEWYRVSSATASQVRVSWSPHSPRCTGADVRGGHGPRAHEIAARPGMRCVVTVRVSNTSSRGVRLGDISAGFVGPHTGTVVQAATVAGEQAQGYPALDGRDVRQPFDRALGPHRSTTFDVVLVFHTGGCNGGGIHLSIFGFPQVDVRTWGRTFLRSSDRDLRFRQAGRARGCRLGGGGPHDFAHMRVSARRTPTGRPRPRSSPRP